MTPSNLSALWRDMAPGLGNHLWQSTVFAAAAGLLTVILRKNHARARYWLWLAASMKFLIPFSLLVGIGSRLAWSPGSTGTNTGLYLAVKGVGQPCSRQFQPTLRAPSRPFPPALVAFFRCFSWLCGSADS